MANAAPGRHPGENQRPWRKPARVLWEPRLLHSQDRFRYSIAQPPQSVCLTAPNDYLVVIFNGILLTFHHINSGEKLTITASGTVGDTVVQGAYVNLVVKYGLITLISQTADLCDQLGNVDLKCPLEKGKMVLTKEVELPKVIPPVRHLFQLTKKYMVKADIRPRANTLSWPMSIMMTIAKLPAWRQTTSRSTCCKCSSSFDRHSPVYITALHTTTRWLLGFS